MDTTPAGYELRYHWGIGGRLALVLFILWHLLCFLALIALIAGAFRMGGMPHWMGDGGTPPGDLAPGTSPTPGASPSDGHGMMMGHMMGGRVMGFAMMLGTLMVAWGGGAVAFGSLLWLARRTTFVAR